MMDASAVIGGIQKMWEMKKKARELRPSVTSTISFPPAEEEFIPDPASRPPERDKFGLNPDSQILENKSLGSKFWDFITNPGQDRPNPITAAYEQAWQRGQNALGIKDNDIEAVLTAQQALTGMPKMGGEGPGLAGPVLRNKYGPTPHLENFANQFRDFIVGKLTPPRGDTALPLTNDIMAQANALVFQLRHPEARRRVEGMHDTDPSAGYNGYYAAPGTWNPTRTYQFDKPTTVISTLPDRISPLTALFQQAGTLNHEFRHWLLKPNLDLVTGKIKPPKTVPPGEMTRAPFQIVGQSPQEMYVQPRLDPKKDFTDIQAWNRIYNRDKKPIEVPNMTDDQAFHFADFVSNRDKRRYDAYRLQTEEKATKAWNKLGEKDVGILSRHLIDQYRKDFHNINLNTKAYRGNKQLKVLKQYDLIEPKVAKEISKGLHKGKLLTDIINPEVIKKQAQDLGLPIDTIHGTTPDKGKMKFRVGTYGEDLMNVINSELMKRGIYKNLPTHTPSKTP